MAVLESEKGSKSKFRRYSYSLIFVVFWMQFIMSQFNGDTQNLYYAYLPAMYGWSRASIALPFSLGQYFAIPINFFAATLLMKVDLKKVMAPSIMIIGAAQWAIGCSSNYAVYFTGFLISSVAIKAMMLCGYQLCTNWYISTRGRVLGVVTMASPFGTAFFVNGITRVVEQVGLVAVYRVIGVVIIAFGVLAHLVIKQKPEDVGLHPDGLPPRAENPAGEEGNAMWPFSRIVRNKEAWFIGLAFGFCNIAMIGCMSTFILRLLEVDMPITSAVNYMSIGAIVGIFVSGAWGIIDDKIGTPKTCMLLGGSYTLFAVFLLLIGISGGSMVFILLATFGISLAAGGLPNLYPSLMAYVFGRKQFLNANRYIEIINLLMAAPVAYIFNWIYDSTGSYDICYYICIVSGLAAMVLFTQIKKSYDPERTATA